MQAAQIETCVTVFNRLDDVKGKLQRCAWQRIVDRLTRHEVGVRDGTLFCGAEFKGQRERAHVTARHLYILDIETSKQTGEIPPEVHEVRAALELRNWAAIIYSTWNHEPGAPRYRVVLLPAASIRFDGDIKAIEDDADVTLGLAHMIGLGGVVDRTKLCAESMFFLPRHGEGREFFTAVVDGNPVEAEELANARAAGRQLREDEDTYVTTATAHPERKDGVIAAFNAASDLAELLEQYGYRRKPRSMVDWRSPYQQSESYATRVYEGRRFVTLSASDIAEGLGRRSRAGSAASGDAFDLYCHFQHKGDQKAAIRAAVKALGLDAKKPGDEWGPTDAANDEDGKPEEGRQLLRIRRADAFAGEYYPAGYLIDYMLQCGFLYSLTAETGAGKTALMILISSLVATGQPFKDAEVKRGNVIYCVGENADEFRQRIICLRENSYSPADYDSIHVLTPEAHKGLLTPEGAAQVAAYAEALGGVDLVVVDTAAAFFDGEDENSNTELGEYARRLRRRLCTLPGKPCVVVCSHPTKHARTHEELVPRGGGAFVAEVDGNLTLMKREVGRSEMFWSKKFRGRIENPVQIALTPVEAAGTRDAKGRPLRSVLASVIDEPDPGEVLAARSLRDRILILMADRRLRTTTDIAVACNEMLPGQRGGNETPGYRKTKFQIDQLVEAKNLRSSDGRWLITPAGQRHAEGLTQPPAAADADEEDAF